MLILTVPLYYVFPCVITRSLAEFESMESERPADAGCILQMAQNGKRTYLVASAQNTSMLQMSHNESMHQVEIEESTDANVLNVVSFNAALTKFAPFYEERRPLIADAVAGLGEDVVCLQEVWLGNDQKSLASALKDKGYHHQYTSSAQPVENGGCWPWEFVNVFACYFSKSWDECSEDFEESPTCFQCLAASTAEHGATYRVLGCLFRGPLMPYGGADGLLLASKLPISDKETVSLSSHLIKRNMLVGKVNGLKIGCAHFSTQKSDNIESMQLVATMTQEPFVVMGDFNTGTDANGMTPYNEESIKIATAAGWRDACLSAGCTWCAHEKDPMVADWNFNAVLDHILVSPSSNISAANASTSLGYDAQPVPVPGNTVTALSDHRALRATLLW